MVEVVRAAARHLADNLHLLRLIERFLRTTPLGFAALELDGARGNQLLQAVAVVRQLLRDALAMRDVLGDAEHSQRRAVGAADRAAAHMDAVLAAIGPRDTVLAVIAGALAHGAIE